MLFELVSETIVERRRGLSGGEMELPRERVAIAVEMPEADSAR